MFCIQQAKLIGAKMIKHRFYFFWALVFILIVALGFAPRYWIPLLRGELDVSSAVHLHAIFSVAWILFYFLQVALISKQRIGVHQKLGYASILLAIGVLVTGVHVSFDLVERSLISGIAGAKPSLLINLLDMVLFAVIYALGIANRKTPGKHKRLITLAVIVLMNAGLFRIGRLIIGPGFAAILLAIVLTAALIILFALLDRKQNGKIHPSVKKVGLVVVLVHIVRIPLAITPVWANITDWLLSVS